MEKRLDYHRPLQTRGGKEVTILTFNGRNPHEPIVGYIGHCQELSYWQADGTYMTDSGAGSIGNDLVNKEGTVFVRYLNWYANGSFGLHCGIEGAKAVAAGTPKHNPLVARVRVEIVEGIFDE